jgi:hypothetical protein
MAWLPRSNDGLEETGEALRLVVTEVHSDSSEWYWRGSVAPD